MSPSSRTRPDPAASRCSAHLQAQPGPRHLTELLQPPPNRPRPRSCSHCSLGGFATGRELGSFSECCPGLTRGTSVLDTPRRLGMIIMKSKREMPPKACVTGPLPAPRTRFSRPLRSNHTGFLSVLRHVALLPTAGPSLGQAAVRLTPASVWLTPPAHLFQCHVRGQAGRPSG